MTVQPSTTEIACRAAPRTPVTVFVADLRASGVVRNAVAIARRLGDRHAVTVVAGAGGLFADIAREMGIEVVLLGRDRGKVGVAARLRRHLIATRPALLLSAGNLGHATVWIAALGLALPCLYRISNPVDRVPGRPSLLRRLKARIVTGGAAGLVLVGTATARTPVFADALREGRARIIPNGVDLDRIAARAAAPAPHPWLAGGPPVLMTVGRLHPQKDMPTLIRAAARAAQSRPLRLVIVGKGSEEAQAALRAVAAAEGFADRLLLAGEQDNVFAWLAHARAFALASRWEGSSMALLEAMAVGLPVVATRSAGDATDVLGDGRWGLLAQAGDVAGLAAAILRQIGDDPVRPGDRAADYGLARTLDLYEAAVDAALAGTERTCAPHAAPASSPWKERA